MGSDIIQPKTFTMPLKVLDMLIVIINQFNFKIACALGQPYRKKKSKKYYDQFKIIKILKDEIERKKLAN